MLSGVVACNDLLDLDLPLCKYELEQTAPSVSNPAKVEIDTEISGDWRLNITAPVVRCTSNQERAPRWLSVYSGLITLSTGDREIRWSDGVKDERVGTWVIGEPLMLTLMFPSTEDVPDRDVHVEVMTLEVSQVREDELLGLAKLRTRREYERTLGDESAGDDLLGELVMYGNFTMYRSF